MRTEPADDVRWMVRGLVNALDFGHVKADNVVCFRSHGSKSRAIARIWALPRIWQDALSVEPHYVIEVLSEKFDGMPLEEKRKTLIHELLHIPKTFSGGLVPHECFGKRIDGRRVDALYEKIKDLPL